MSLHKAFHRGGLAVSLLVVLSAAHPALAQGCISPGEWRMPVAGSLQAVAAGQVAASAEVARFLLLGEEHDVADHHRWQLHSIAMLLAARRELVIGIEMLPRRAQPLLDRWVAGTLSEAALLRETQWNEVWGFDPQLYLPLFHFARIHRIPLVALNVDRELIREVGAKGWKSIPEDRREGVGDPSPPTAAYRQQLRAWFGQHRSGQASDAGSFDRFVEAQITWDRAFAEALVKAAADHPDALVVGIIGTGHLLSGYGVPHQLREMGARSTRVWLPVSAQTPCSELKAELADALFGIAPLAAADTPRLGVLLDESSAGPRVREVLSDSVAERAGVQRGDRVVAAAGLPMASASDLIALIRRQPPGTWLPIRVERSGREVELVAKFPASTE